MLGWSQPVEPDPPVSSVDTPGATDGIMAQDATHRKYREICCLRDQDGGLGNLLRLGSTNSLGAAEAMRRPNNGRLPAATTQLNSIHDTRAMT